MRPIQQGSVVVGAAGSINNNGTITGTGVDWAPTFEPYAVAVINMGVITAAGSVLVDVQTSDVLGSGYASVGSLAFAGAPAGTQAYAIPFTADKRYVRVVENVGAGSCTVATTFVGKPRTVTS